MCKQMSSDSLYCSQQTIRLQIIYIYNLALNNPQGLICHKTQPDNYDINISI